jgi:hypothetical protein
VADLPELADDALYLLFLPLRHLSCHHTSLPARPCPRKLPARAAARNALSV